MCGEWAAPAAKEQPGSCSSSSRPNILGQARHSCGHSLCAHRTCANANDKGCPCMVADDKTARACKTNPRPLADATHEPPPNNTKLQDALCCGPPCADHTHSKSPETASATCCQPPTPWAHTNTAAHTAQLACASPQTEQTTRQHGCAANDIATNNVVAQE